MKRTVTLLANCGALLPCKRRFEKGKTKALSFSMGPLDLRQMQIFAVIAAPVSGSGLGEDGPPPSETALPRPRNGKDRGPGAAESP